MRALCRPGIYAYCVAKGLRLQLKVLGASCGMVLLAATATKVDRQTLHRSTWLHLLYAVLGLGSAFSTQCSTMAVRGQLTVQASNGQCMDNGLHRRWPTLYVTVVLCMTSYDTLPLHCLHTPMHIHALMHTRHDRSCPVNPEQAEQAEPRLCCKSHAHTHAHTNRQGV